MRIRLARHTALALAVLFTIGFCLVDTSAQQRRRKRSRRITNPVVSNAPPTQPDTSQANGPEPKIISTAEEQVNDLSGEPAVAGGTRRGNRTRASDTEQDSMRRTVNKLSTQVNQLKDKLGQMEEQQRTLVNLERLTRAEQRAEGLRAQLRDVQTREADLGARADQLDEALKPENIERAVSVYGTTRPEEARDQRRRQLENERARVRTQLDQLAASRAHLESSIANADAEADHIRQLVDAAAPDSGTMNNTGGQSSTTTTGTTQTSPSTSGPSTPGPSTAGSSGSGPPLR